MQTEYPKTTVCKSFLFLLIFVLDFCNQTFQTLLNSTLLTGRALADP